MNEFFTDLFKDENNERKLKEVYKKVGEKFVIDSEPTKLTKAIVIRNCKLSEEFIDKYFKNDLGDIILSYQKLNSEYLMEKIRKKEINIEDLISKVLLNQKIDEKYLLELVELHESPSKAWSIISYKQELSLEFIEENLKNLSKNLSNLVFYQPKVDFQFLNKIVDLEDIESLPENVFRYMVSSINLPSDFIIKNWNHLNKNKFILSDLLYLQPRIPENLLSQLEKSLGKKAYNRRIFNSFSSSGNYSLIYVICNESGLILYPIGIGDLDLSFEYENNNKLSLYKAIVDIRKIPRVKFLYKNYCEKLVEIDRDNVSIYKRFSPSIKP